MANIFRKTYTIPIPPSAELFNDAKGKPAARFLCKRRMVTGLLTEAGDRVRIEAPKYYGWVRGKEVRLFTDARASQQRLAELLRKAERQQCGMADPFESHRQRPLIEHLADYIRFIEAEGNTAEYVAQTESRIKAIFVGCAMECVPDISPEKVAEFLHSLRRDPLRPKLPTGKTIFTPAELTAALGGQRPAKLSRIIAREGLDPGAGKGPNRLYPRATVERLQELICRGIGISTSNGYLTAIKGFSGWLLEKERVDRDRLVSLSRLNADSDLRHARRALEECDLNKLLASAWHSPVTFEVLTGHDRAMIYMLAMSSGFRASELASLTPFFFHLNDDRPTVTARAAYTKNRREAQQPVPLDVAEAFRKYLRGRAPQEALWPGRWNKRGAEMLRGDLEGAGIPYRDPAGNVADFHSLRHSYISLLAATGAHPKVAQELARHSDIKLTMNVYTHARAHDLAAAVDNLPIVLPDTSKFESMKATGTDGKATLERKIFQCASSDLRTDAVGYERLCTSGGVGDDGTELTQATTGERTCTLANASELKRTELPRLDSNQDKESQNLLCYRYTTGYWLELSQSYSSTKENQAARAHRWELGRVPFRRPFGVAGVIIVA